MKERERGRKGGKKEEGREEGERRKGGRREKEGKEREGREGERRRRGGGRRQGGWGARRVEGRKGGKRKRKISQKAWKYIESTIPTLPSLFILYKKGLPATVTAPGPFQQCLQLSEHCHPFGVCSECWLKEKRRWEGGGGRRERKGKRKEEERERREEGGKREE